MLKPLQTFMEKPMDRKQFLQTVGVGLFSLIGLSAILPSLSKLPQAGPSRTGYGMGRYTVGKDGQIVR
jgi:hypothetical protein